MTVDRAFVEQNRASSRRLRDLVARLSDQQLQRRVGQHWTVAIALAHLAFWDRRALQALDITERDGKPYIPILDILVNDASLALWAAMPPREAARIALETAEQLDKRLEGFPPALLEELYAGNQRLVMRALHRNEHLDEVEAALKS
jgi:hypothetical protein